MSKIAILCGAILVTIGLIGYFGGTSDSNPDATISKANDDSSGSNADANSEDVEKPKSRKTALIPALVGVLLMMAGTLALDPKMHKHGMHAAAGIALLGTIASIVPLSMTISKISAGTDINYRSTLFVVIMAVVCLTFLVLSIRSFIAARRARETAS